MDELLGLSSLYLAFFVGWVLLGHGPFLLQSNPCLLYGLVDTSAMLPHCLCHVVFWSVLAGPPLGLPHTFPFTQFMQPSTTTGLVLILFWASLACFIHLGILGPLHSFGHPQPILILHSHEFLLNLSSFPDPITTSFTFGVYWPFYQPHLLILSFGLLWPIFA